MKYLFCAVNAKFIHSNPAVYSLKAYARSQGIPEAQMVIREYTINQYVDEILADLYEEGMDVLILSCYLWNARHVMEIGAEYRKIDPKVQIWLGGPEVSYDGADFLRANPWADLVMQGEGEETFAALAGACEAGRLQIQTGLRGDRTFLMSEECRKLPGLVYRSGDEIADTGLSRVDDLDSIPFLYEGLLDHGPGVFENRIIYYESSRGCPFHCSYCLSSVDERVRFRSLSLVIRELEVFLKARVQQVKFVDRTFNCRRDHALGIWKYLADHDNGVTNFHFEIAGDLLTEEALALFGTMRPGLIQLEIGLQSTHDPTLSEIDRRMNMDRLFQNFHAVRQTGNIHQHLDLIAGLPHEGYDRFGQSFSRAFIFLPDQLQLGFLKVLKGTRMREKAAEYDLVYREQAPYEVIRTRWMDYGDLIRLKRISQILEIWYNSGQYYYTMKYVVPFYETPFVFFERFADWYHERGYDRLNHSRLAKCHMLHDFLMTHDELAADRESLEDIMLYDWYRKEKSKSRPDFAPDYETYKEEYKSFYRTAGDRLFPDRAGYDSRKAAARSHIEHFRIDMEAFLLYGEVRPYSCFMLFDYEDLHPLTHAARNLQWGDGELPGAGDS